MARRGRPVQSDIRQNMIEILFHLQKAYGYEIYKTYIKIFPKVTLRVIYYHLKKGIAIGEFKVLEIQKEKGNYSWGPEAEKTYYALGPQAKVTDNQRVAQYFSELHTKEKEENKAESQN